MTLMKRVITSTCLAAAFAVGLAAQSTSTAQDPPAGQRGGPRPVTATGCLRAGDTAGTFMLTDVQMQGGGRRGADTTGTTAGTTTTSGTTSGTAGSTATGTAQAGRGNMPTSLMLNPAADVDLKAHVGHKIEVTGTMAGGRGGAGGTGTTAGTTSGTTTSGTTGTGTTATGTSAAGGGTQGGGRGARNVTVTSVRMVSESCS
jgi:hypothetical protein